MAKLVWLGEPDGEEEGPRKNTWNGMTFIRGEEVEVTNPHMIAKARKNPFYSVDGETYVPNGKQPQEPGEQRGAAGPRVTDKTELSEMSVKELREIAEARGIDVHGLTKSEMREKIAAAPAA